MCHRNQIHSQQNKQEERKPHGVVVFQCLVSNVILEHIQKVSLKITSMIDSILTHCWSSFQAAWTLKRKLVRAEVTLKILP